MNGFDDEIMNNESALVDFDGDFPLQPEQHSLPENQRKEAILDVLKQCKLLRGKKWSQDTKTTTTTASSSSSATTTASNATTSTVPQQTKAVDTVDTPSSAQDATAGSDEASKQETSNAVGIIDKAFSAITSMIGTTTATSTTSPKQAETALDPKVSETPNVSAKTESAPTNKQSAATPNTSKCSKLYIGDINDIHSVKVRCDNEVQQHSDEHV